MLTYKHSRKQVKSCIVLNDIFAFCVMCYQLDHDKQGSCLLSQEALPSTFTERHCNLFISTEHLRHHLVTCRFVTFFPVALCQTAVGDPVLIISDTLQHRACPQQIVFD